MHGLWTVIIAAALASHAGTSPPLAAAEPQEVDESLAVYADPAGIVTLPDGRSIHLVCMGEGSPTVVLTAGALGWSIAWSRVQPLVAGTTRTCAWDRAGTGFSGPGPLPRSAVANVADLEAVLAASGVDGPLIMVGHSLGAYETLMFADRQPRQVTGVVLVDPSLPDMMARFRKAAPATAEFYALPERDQLALLLEACAAIMRGATPSSGGPDRAECLAPQPVSPEFPPALVDALAARTRNASDTTIAEAMETFASLIEAQDVSQKLVVNPARDFGDMPLLVLTREYSEDAPADWPPEVVAELPLEYAEWTRAHREYAALSTRGEQRVVPGGTHGMTVEMPHVVADAIREVITEARKGN
jgi:pimeloyl-ACP methyl ester carboxylesterase